MMTSKRMVVLLLLALWSGFSVAARGSQMSQSPTIAPPSTQPTRISVSEGVESASLVHYVEPEYPEYIKEQKITGVLIFHAMIGADGVVSKVDLVSGPSELKYAATDAILQWRYQPKIVDGQAVEVETYITIVYGKKGAEKYQPIDDPNHDLFKERPFSAAVQAPSSSPMPGRVEPGLLILQVEPEYPAGAKAEHIQGKVVLSAVISREGDVISLDYVSGPLDLVQAAKEAVFQWKYKPLRLNGEPHAVKTPITVTFNLAH